MPHERTPKNVPGPFYVIKDECIACGAPEAEAPTLMAFDDDAGSCYFRRQPSDPAETDRAIRAVWASCCGAVRYGGSEPAVLARLRIDAPVRNRVTFLGPRTDCSPVEFLEALLTRLHRHGPDRSVKRLSADATGAKFSYGWRPTMTGVTIEITVLDGDLSQWQISIGPVESPAITSIAIGIDDALTEDWRVAGRHWFPIKPTSPHDWSEKPL
jgi:ferredoxin